MGKIPRSTERISKKTAYNLETTSHIMLSISKCISLRKEWQHAIGSQFNYRITLWMSSGDRWLSSMSTVNILCPYIQTRLRQQLGGRDHTTRHHAVPVDHRGTSRAANQHHPLGLRQRRRHRAFNSAVVVGRWTSPAVPSVRRHQRACAGQKFHRKPFINKVPVMLLRIILRILWKKSSRFKKVKLYTLFNICSQRIIGRQEEAGFQPISDCPRPIEVNSAAVCRKKVPRQRGLRYGSFIDRGSPGPSNQYIRRHLLFNVCQ